MRTPRTATHRRSGRRPLSALVCGLLAAAVVLAVPGAAPARTATAAGDLDADVVLASGAHRGALAGSLHGNLTGRGGFVVFTPAAGRTRAGLMRLRATRGGDGAWRLRGRGPAGSRLALRLGGRRLTGRGAAPGGRRVRVHGYAGVARPDVGRGRLLVVGSGLGGEARAALGRSYRLSPARPSQLARTVSLAHPRRLRGVAGVVVGRRASLSALARNGALRSLSDGHRWVMVAGATNSRLVAAKAAGLPTPRMRRTAPLVALRRGGARGLPDGARSIVVYPGKPVTHMSHRFLGQAPQRLKMTYPDAILARLKAGRIAFLGRALRRHGAAYSGAGRRARASQSSGPGGQIGGCGTPASAAGTPSPGAASCYTISVNSFASQPFGPSANMSAFCGTYQDLDSTFGNNNAPGYCPYTWQNAGLPSGSYPGTPPPSSAPAPYWGVDYPVYFNACPSWWTNSSSQSNVIQSSFGNQDNPFNASQMLSASQFTWNWLGSIVFESNIDSYTGCPTQSWQPAQFEIEDTYTALYEPQDNQQAILAATNSEITPASPALGGYTPEDADVPIVTQTSNGKYSNRADGGASNAPIPETCCLLGQDVVTMQYEPPSGASDEAQVFTIDSTHSFPTGTITDEQDVTTTSTTEGWNVGVSASGSPGASAGWTSTTQNSSQMTINVPNWQVSPQDTTLPDGTSQIVYTWSSQIPVDYDDAFNCSPCPNPGYGQPAYTGNDLMYSSWSPNSQTAWASEQGQSPGGTPTAGIEHDFAMMDYYTAWSAAATTIDKYPGWREWLWADGDWSYTSGATLDFCDPLVLPASGTAPLC